MSQKADEPVEFTLIKYMNIIIENGVILICERSSELYRIDFELFVIVDPHIVKHEYVYASGCLKIVPNQSFRIKIKKDHAQILPLKEV